MNKNNSENSDKLDELIQTCLKKRRHKYKWTNVNGIKPGMLMTFLYGEVGLDGFTSGFSPTCKLPAIYKAFHRATSVLDVDAASKTQQRVSSRAHVVMQDQHGLIQLRKAGLTFENQSTDLTTSTEEGKTYNQLKRCRKALDKVQGPSPN